MFGGGPKIRLRLDAVLHPQILSDVIVEEQRLGRVERRLPTQLRAPAVDIRALPVASAHNLARCLDQALRPIEPDVLEVPDRGLDPVEPSLRAGVDAKLPGRCRSVEVVLLGRFSSPFRVPPRGPCSRPAAHFAQAIEVATRPSPQGPLPPPPFEVVAE